MYSLHSGGKPKPNFSRFLFLSFAAEIRWRFSLRVTGRSVCVLEFLTYSSQLNSALFAIPFRRCQVVIVWLE